MKIFDELEFSEMMEYEDEDEYEFEDEYVFLKMNLKPKTAFLKFQRRSIW